MSVHDVLPPLGVALPHLRGSGGYADLLLALTVGGEEELATVAALLGYKEKRRALPQGGPEPAASFHKHEAGIRDTEVLRERLLETPFWRSAQREFLKALDIESSELDQSTPWLGLDSRQPMPRPLSSWRTLVPSLRSAFTELAESCDADVGTMIHRFSEGQLLKRVPRLRRRRWGERIQIVVDRSEHLVPFWHDQDWVTAHFTALFPRYGIETALVLDGSTRPLVYAPNGKLREYRLPAARTLVVVLGDLGCLADQGLPILKAWDAFGRRLAGAGCRPVALTPCPPSRWQPDLLSSWTLVPWERRRRGTRPDTAELDAQAERLLTLLSPAIRVEPGLLRDMRLLLGPTADAGTEADVWRHSALAGRSCVAATFDPKAADRLREAFERLPADMQAAVLGCMRRWRGGDLAREIWFEELLSLDPGVVNDLPEPLCSLIRYGDLPQAHRFWTRLAPALVESDPFARLWYRGVHTRASPHYHACRNEELRAAQYRMFVDTFRDIDAPPPPGFDPLFVPGERERYVELRHVEDTLEIAELGAGSHTGCPLAVLRTAADIVAVNGGESPEDRNAFWRSGSPPPWAEEWGEDEFGAWVTFSVAGKKAKTAEAAPKVSQRLRWIPPGRFLMGSPEDEPGRDKDEGPRHQVTISRGFWLMDTVCTQALWQAVMGNNPSHFKGLELPVEQVSWHDVQEFVARINERVPKLALNLPTEAQWEYACRAGTTSPFSFGSSITPKQVNYNGTFVGGRKWKGQQETVRVASLPPNTWGLYEMHGNVWEWCLDGPRRYQLGSEVNPSGPLESNFFIVRGGAWGYGASLLRAASRVLERPVKTHSTLGFRCVHVQDGAEPIEPWRVREASLRTAAGWPSGAVLRLDRGESADRCPLPRARSFQVRTDRERLSFSRFTQSDCGWAEEIGRDRFGLWACIEIEDVSQRLRWLPPGRFLMGSPEGESERFDSEGPQHEVAFSQGFWLFDTACTQALWQAVMGQNPSRFKEFKDSSCYPVEQVSWNEVQSFITKINDMKPNLTLTISSEAQWEYACRAGTSTAFSFGATITPEQVNYDGNHPYVGGKTGFYREKTVPVACLPPNPWGLYEMHGNVWEWCADDWHYSYEGAPTDGTAWQASGNTNTGEARVIRGGSWSYDARRVRAAVRSRDHPDNRSSNLGFRCSRVQS